MTARFLSLLNRLPHPALPGLLAGLTLLLGGNVAAQVSVTATAGTPGPTPYTTVGAAFTEVNNGTHQGDITLNITGDTTEPATAALNASGTGAALYTSVRVAPSGGPRVITGNVVGAIIRLNGADNVTIDGRIAGSGRNLTVANGSASTATAAIWLSSTGVGAGATGNVIRNLELACGATQNTLTVNTFGILMSGTAISTASLGDDNDNNSFIANRIIRVRYGIVTRGQTANNNLNPVVTDNIIGPSAFGADEIGKTAILMQADTGGLVSRNAIQFVGGCLLGQTCTAGADRVGIGIGSEAWSATTATTLTSGDYTVTKNIIHDVVEERTFSAVGIMTATTRGGVATSNLIANNFIYNIRANATAGDQVVGIGIVAGHTDSIIHNSIAITGDMDPGAAAAASTYGNAIRITTASSASHANLTLADNSIFMDVNSNTATLPFFAITINSAAYSFGTGLMNNNNLFVNLGNAQMNTGGLSASGTAPAGATLFNTLAQWQTAMTAPQDAASIQLDPLYSSNSADLHIQGSSPNVGAALNLGLSDDIDGEARDATPDIGADEFVTVPLPGTLQFNSATYVGNEGTGMNVIVRRVIGSMGIVSVDTTLSGGSAIGGASCSGGVDYVNPGTQTLTFGNGITSRSFSVTLCADAVFDPGETFNLALSNATGGALIGSPASATATITDVAPPFSGSVNVGSGQNYTSLTNPGGMFETLNNSGVAGNLSVNITSDLAGETGAIALNELAGGFTLTIRPGGGAPRIVTGSSAGILIPFNGADRVTLNGSLSGTGTDRSLTFQNTNTGTSSSVINFGSGAAGAQNNTLKNLIVMGNDPLQTLLGISLGGAAAGTTGTDNDGNRIENCAVRRTVFGIYAAGQSAANPNTGTVITRNDLTGTTTERVQRVGMLFFSEDGIQVTENNVGGMDSAVNADVAGIGLGAGAADAQISTTNVTGGGITNALVSRNRVDGVTSTAAAGFSAVGIAVAGGAGANTVQNNMISRVTAPATVPDIVVGIYVVGAAGSTTRLYNNSVSLTGDRGAVANQLGSFGVAITGADPAVELKDNIFYTTQTSGGGVNAISYSIGMMTTTFVNLDSNYNNFFASGANAGFFRTGSLAGGAGTDYATLPLWQAAVSDDANSIFADPLFVSASDLHLLSCASPAMAAGTPLAGVAVDFDGDSRSVTAPGIGADEAARVTLTASAGANGSISPNGAVTVACAANQLFTMTPAAGYAINDVLVDGASVGTPATYNFLNVTIPHTIAVSFRGIIGAVPDRLSLGSPLRISKNGGNPAHLDLTWGDSCGAGQTDFAVYEGIVGTWYSHVPKQCSTAGAMSVSDITPLAGSAYYLIVPLSASAEGSYGTDSSGTQIPQRAGACFALLDTVACS